MIPSILLLLVLGLAVTLRTVHQSVTVMCDVLCERAEPCSKTHAAKELTAGLPPSGLGGAGISNKGIPDGQPTS